MRPLETIPNDVSKPWYTKQRVGVNKLKEILPRLSLESKCEVKYTNHSLRATSATRMFTGGVPEKLVAEKTGHRSLQALRSYEKTNPEMERAIDAIIANPEKKFLAENDASSENKLLAESDSSVFEDVSHVDNIIGQKDELPGCSSGVPHPKTKPEIPVGHTFSGSLNNCTINISYH